MTPSVLAALSMSLLLATTQPRADEIVLASPDYWCPFSCKAGSAQEGVAIDIIREIFGAAGHSVRLVNENYSRALMDVRAGSFTATPATYKEEAPDFIFPDQPIARLRFCVFVATDKRWSYGGPASLAALSRIGIIRDYAYGAGLDAAIKAAPQRFELHAGDGLTERMLRRLQLGRVDALIEDEGIVAYALRQQPGLKARNAGCETASYAYMAISPKHPKAAEYARLFSDGMTRLRKNGRLKAILAGYGIPDWTPPNTH